MFEKFLSENSQDFRQRYEGTYGYFVNHDNGTRRLCMLSSVDNESRPRVVYFKDAQGVSFSVNADAQADIGFEFLPPRSAYYNTTKGVFFIQRVPARQFSRGLRHSNTKIYKVLAGGWTEVDVGFDSLLPIYEYRIGFIDAVNTWIKGGKKGPVALSPAFCINEKAVNVLGESIGTFDGTNIRLDSGGNIFLPELKQAIMACHASLDVVEKIDG